MGNVRPTARPGQCRPTECAAATDQAGFSPHHRQTGYDTLGLTKPYTLYPIPQTPPAVTRRKPPSKQSGLVGVVADHAVYRSFSQFSQTQAWSPAVNIYQVGKQLHICVDLAGIDRDKIDVRIEPGRLTVSGVRHAPEPKPAVPATAAPHAPPRPQPDTDMKIHSMEIDYGAFRRVIQVPQQIKLESVRSEYRQGLLWITLPLT